MKTSIATVCLSGTLAEKLRAIADAGFDGVEIFEQDLVVSPHSPEQIRRRAEELGLSIDLYQPFRDLAEVGEDQFQRNLRRLEAKLQLTARLGCHMLLCCSNASTATVDDDAIIADQLRRAAELAERYDVSLAYEALAWGTYVNTYRRSYDLVRRAHHPRLGICLDSFHILSRGDDPSGIAQLDPATIFFIQMADAPHRELPLLEWSRHSRVFPGEGQLPTHEVLAAARGYHGPVSLEIFNDSFREADARRTARDGLRSLRWAADAAGIEPLPPASPAVGWDAVTLRSSVPREVEHTLATCGFRPVPGCTGGEVGPAATDVNFWHSGDAILAVGGSDTPSASTRAVGYGLRVEDPDAAYRRALAMGALPAQPSGWSHNPRRRCVTAPDGTALSFAPAQGSSSDLGAAAEPDDAHRSPDHPQSGSSPFPEAARITGIDHAVLPQQPHHLPEARLFYHATAGLSPADPQQITTPAGLVTSQQLSGAVRLTVEVPPALSEQGRFFSADYPQRLCLATKDALGFARASRARGAATLPVPPNYYEDLAARTGRDVTELRRAGVLLDEEDGAAFLQVVIVLPGGFQLVVAQRDAGYHGCGLTDAPVLLAAEYRERRDDVRGIPH